jgi:hypothetical protein
MDMRLSTVMAYVTGWVHTLLNVQHSTRPQMKFRIAD